MLAGDGFDLFCFYYLGGSRGTCHSNKEEGMADAEMSATSFLKLFPQLVGIPRSHRGHKLTGLFSSCISSWVNSDSDPWIHLPLSITKICHIQADVVGTSKEG